MKNMPQRERPQHRNRSSYNRNGKREYDYPGWVRNKTAPPQAVCIEIAKRFRAHDWPIPAIIQQGSSLKCTVEGQ